MKAAIKNELGETLATIELAPKTFKTGSRGYWGAVKVQNGGKRYQVQVQAVEIGSKGS